VFSRFFSAEPYTLISVHTHNDRGCAIAAAELALLAGASRVEGTLFGNGERTGNLDIVTMALNLTSHGIDTELNLSRIKEIGQIYTQCTGMTIPVRHPYAGELVFTAFSGTHQDAIRKGLEVRKEKPEDTPWDVPYLPMDPLDLHRDYREIIRVNSQSGKGGASYVLEQELGKTLSREMSLELGRNVNLEADRQGRELELKEIVKLYKALV
jgi:2-isopropylmalate synthase